VQVFYVVVFVLCIPEGLKWARAVQTPGFPLFTVPWLTPATLDSVLADEVRILQKRPELQGAEFRRLRVVCISQLPLTDADRENGISRARCYTITGIYRLSGSIEWDQLEPEGIAYVVLKSGQWYALDAAAAEARFGPGLCPCQKRAGRGKDS